MDSITGFEETVCLYGDAAGLEGYTSVNATNYDEVPMSSAESLLYNGSGTLINDSGVQSSGYATVSTTPTANVTYTLIGLANECVDPTNSGDSGSCSLNLYGNASLSVSAEVTPAPPPVLSLSTSASPSTYGNSVIFTLLESTAGVEPFGSVTFNNGGSSLGSGSLTGVSIQNLLDYSQQFGSTSAWSGYCGPTSNMTVNTTDLAAPDGTSTATKFVIPSTVSCGANVSWGVLQAVPGGLTAGQTYTVSLWLRGGSGGENVAFGLNDCEEPSVNITNSWQRYSFTFSNLPAGVASCGDGTRGFQVLDTNPNQTYYVWGAQLEAESSVGPYVPSTSNPATGYGGLVTYSTSSLPVGSNSISATWNGGTGYSSVTSSSLTQTVNQATPSLSVSSSSSTANYNASVTFTATISNGLTGTITFYDGGTSIGTGSISSGVATFATSSLAVSTHSITAGWAGNTDYSAVTSGTITQTIVPATPTLSISTSKSPSAYESSVTFTAVLSAEASGSVTFYDGSTSIGTATISGTTATLSTSSLAVGSHVISFSWSGNTDYASASSGIITEIIYQAGPVQIPASGIINTIAGNGTPGYSGDGVGALVAEISSPAGVALDSSGNIYIADNGAQVIREVNAASGTITTIAGNGTAGHTGDSSTVLAQLDYPSGIAIDAVNNILYIADTENHVVWGISLANSSGGAAAIVAGTLNSSGYSGDGGSGPSSQLHDPYNLAVDSTGNVYIADEGNNRIRKLTLTTGVITTVAGNGTYGFSGDGSAATSAEMESPTSVAVDASGNIYFVDLGNTRVRKVTASTGNISTVAGGGSATGDGGAATSANLGSPYGLAVDASGNLYISASFNSRVRLVTASTGIITTYAGNGTYGYTGDGGPATSAEVGLNAGSLTLDVLRNLYIADKSNSRIRVVGAAMLANPSLTVTSSSSPSTYTQSVTFTATIASGPTGAVYFYDGATELGVGTIAGTTATFTTATLTIGSHTITTYWPGNASYPAVTSNPITQTVNIAELVVSSSNASSTYGGSVTLTATVPSGGTGTVTFKDGTTTLASETITSGVATYTSSALLAGSHPITASWPGSGSYGAVTSSVFTQVVNQATPSITWSTPSAITYGTALSSTQLDASATCNGTSSCGTFVYTPASGEILDAGSQSLLASFFPTDSTDFAIATHSVPLTVNSGTTAAIYSYSIANGSSSGYAPNGNIVNYTDSVTGTWSMVSGSSGGSSGYDSLNRLGAARHVPVSGSTQYFCWSYDSFGNRTYQQSSSAAFTNTTAVNTSTGNTCTPASGATILSSEWNNYYATSTNPSTDPGTNQIQSSNGSGSTATFTYDAAGNVTYDGSNHYLYDAEGEQCAVENSVGVTTGYVYDAEGNRVAKGTLASFSCTATFAMTNTYILDQSNQQITEETVSGTTATWAHSNVFAAGELIATYDYKSDGTSPLSFNLADWLGTKRVVTDYEGNVTETWTGLPFGDGLTELTGSADDTEHHFTGKERDTESGLDYFGARYYASSMGRFMSPDWSAKAEPVPYSKLDNPQSLNLYAYALNNPLSNVDVDGHETEAEKQAAIAAAAKAQNGSTSYNINTTNVSNMQIFKPGSDKCNEFVADTVKSADGTRPVVDGTGKIPTAAQFADPNVKITGLSAPEPLANAKPGDVIAQDHGAGKNGNEEGHVGIVTALPHDGQPGQTASANANVGGRVTVNDWGFRSPTASPNNGERNGAASPAPVVRHPLGDPQ